MQGFLEELKGIFRTGIKFITKIMTKVRENKKKALLRDVKKVNSYRLLRGIGKGDVVWAQNSKLSLLYVSVHFQIFIQ